MMSYLCLLLVSIGLVIVSSFDLYKTADFPIKTFTMAVLICIPLSYDYIDSGWGVCIGILLGYYICNMATASPLVGEHFTADTDKDDEKNEDDGEDEDEENESEEKDEESEETENKQEMKIEGYTADASNESNPIDSALNSLSVSQTKFGNKLGQLNNEINNLEQFYTEMKNQ